MRSVKTAVLPEPAAAEINRFPQPDMAFFVHLSKSYQIIYSYCQPAFILGVNTMQTNVPHMDKRPKFWPFITKAMVFATF